MERVISATQARIHFGELLRQVAETREPVIVERDGQPQVVVIAMETYQRLKEQPTEDWRTVLDQIITLAAQIRAERGGQPLPPPDEIIHQMREERDEQLAAACGLP
jgi:prevent-host-death family protein